MGTELQKHRATKTIAANVTILSGSIVIGAAGAITSQTGQRGCGVTFTKNAQAGQYDGVIHRGYRKILAAHVAVATPTAGGVMVATDGNTAYMTGIPATGFSGTATFSTFSIQCQLPTGVATATNPKSGDIVNWTLVLSDGP